MSTSLSINVIHKKCRRLCEVKTVSEWKIWICTLCEEKIPIPESLIIENDEA